MHRLTQWTGTCMLALLAAGCGGGGGEPGASVGPGTGVAASGAALFTPMGGEACSSEAIPATISYADGFAATEGMPFSSTPTLAGVPPSCARALQFTVASGSLPAGVSLDPASGVLSGTPSLEGSWPVTLQLTIAGMQGTLQLPIKLEVASAPRLFAFWQQSAPNPAFADFTRLAVLGGRLYAVTRDAVAHGVATYVSTDGGKSWTRVEGAAPTGDLRGFALASDATGIYLSGGNDGTGVNSRVWRFDGSAWTLRAAMAPFPPREHHAMVSHAGALYILGGQTAGETLEDTWRSVDGGATWVLTSMAGFKGRYDFCAVSDGTGSLYVTGGHKGSAPSGGDRATDVLFRTTDGSAWVAVPLPSNSPLVFATAARGSGACAMLGGRVLYIQPGPIDTHPSAHPNTPGPSHTVSSADGINWRDEPSAEWWTPELNPGAVVLDGVVYVSTTSGTLLYTVTR